MDIYALLAFLLTQPQNIDCSNTYEQNSEEQISCTNVSAAKSDGVASFLSPDNSKRASQE